MKNLSLLLAVVVFLLLISSCRSSKIDTVDTEARQYEIHAQHGSFLTRPLIADLEVDNTRQEIEYTGPLNLSLDDLKKNATELFLKTYECDYVADPVFEVERKKRNNFTREIKITLKGFPVLYTDIYQVDTLPESINQYSSINREINRIRYYNSIEEERVVWGVEALLGEYLGAQIDFPLGEDTRYYLSFQKMDSPWSFTADIFEDRSSESYVGSGEGQDYFTVSTGLFREAPVADHLNIRYGGGLNFTSYGLTTDFVGMNQVEFSHIYNLGIRLKVGLDFPIYRNFSIIGQLHYNLDGLNIVITDDPGIVANADMSVEDIDISKTPDPPLYLGLGLRVVF